MLLGKYYNAIEIHRADKIIFAAFLKPHRLLSTCRAAGGLREGFSHVYNHQSCEPAGHSHGLPKTVMTDPQAYNQFICERHGLPADSCATLGTAANMNNAAIVRETCRALEVIAVCTGGVECNAGRAGDPASVYESDNGFEKMDAAQKFEEHGTINTMIFINRELTEGAMVRVVMTATEAKTAVLQELAVNSRYSDGLATGTGTDQIAVACQCDTGKPLTSAGKHCKLGELIGKSVYQAIKQTLALQNGLTPPGQCSSKIHLERFGADREQMISGVGHYLTVDQRKLLANNFDAVDRDPVTVAAVAALVHLRDKFAWGILPESCRPEVFSTYGAQLTAAVSGNDSRMDEYREKMAAHIHEVEATDFLSLVYRAFALGFKEKWKWHSGL